MIIYIVTYKDKNADVKTKEVSSETSSQIWQKIENDPEIKEVLNTTTIAKYW